MQSMPVPKSSKSLETLIREQPALRFPGYGMTYNGTVHNSAGNKYVLFEYQIPETGMQRSLLYSLSQEGSCHLALDVLTRERPTDTFIPDSDYVRVENENLVYYNKGVVYQQFPLVEAQ
jgi:hypothetical protein